MRNLSTARYKLMRALCLWAGLLMSQFAWAAAGKVSHVSGPLFAVGPDGSKRVLVVGSDVHQGDTLLTEDKTYARIKFSDQAEVTLRPGSQLKVERYSFAEAQPTQDSAVLGLFKGALRTVTGLIGKRGNREAYSMTTATATIGIRGTTYGAIICPHPSCPPELPEGTYIDVNEGAIEVGTVPPVGCAMPGSSSNLPPCPPLPPAIVLTAGQFGFVPPIGAPQILPAAPPIDPPKLPPAFESSSIQSQGSSSVGSPCEVR